MLNFEYWIWMLNFNIQFEYWILNLSIKFECWIWILNIEYKFKCYWSWVWYERLCLYFQVADISCFRFWVCAAADGLRAGCFGCIWLLRPTDGGIITFSRNNGINWCHCWMWNFCCIWLDSLMLSKLKSPRRVRVISWRTENWLVTVNLPIEYTWSCQEFGWVG